MIREDFLIDLNNLKTFTHGSGPIVVVDDDEAQILLIQTCYKKTKRPNELICVQSGEELLKLFEQVKDHKMPIPELVLLDINMPKKNGFDVLKEIRDSDDFKYIPLIIMFTTSDSESDIAKANNLHANGFFSKPSNMAGYIAFFQGI